jgi:hypothetical protein
MPPRKPKQPVRKKAAPRKGVGKKAEAKKASTIKTAPDGSQYDDATHILCDDGKVYERKVVSGTGTAVGVNATERTTAHEELETKMSRAILQAHSEGISDPKEIQKRMLQARENHLDGK